MRQKLSTLRPHRARTDRITLRHILRPRRGGASQARLPRGTLSPGIPHEFGNLRARANCLSYTKREPHLQQRTLVERPDLGHLYGLPLGFPSYQRCGPSGPPAGPANEGFIVSQLKPPSSTRKKPFSGRFGRKVGRGAMWQRTGQPGVALSSIVSIHNLPKGATLSAATPIGRGTMNQPLPQNGLATGVV